MKKILMVIAAVSAMVVSAETKIAFVDMSILLKMHPQYDSDGRLLKETDSEYQEKLDKRQDELKKLAEDGKKAAEEAQNPMLGAKARQEAMKKVADLERKFIAAQQDLQREAAKYRDEVENLNARLLRTRMAEIREKTAEYAKGAGYDIVLDKSLTAYVDDKYDITDKILLIYGVDPATRPDREAAK
ncbi:MAG: OmpH family outer membrane protein [Kiritimatiellae bacterium]|nr:OmpH family outer membrane protein [Kiritimatiellia bacterium]